MIVITKAKNYNGQAVRFVTEKHDGHRRTIHVSRSGIHAYTRGKQIDDWPELREIDHIRRLVEAVPMGTWLDTELWAPGIKATSVPTLINDRSPHLRITPFALPVYKGEDMRGADLRGIHALLRDMGFTPPEIIVITSDPAPISEDMVNTLKQRALREKREGYVAKLAHYEGWYKIKPKRSLDAVVVGAHGGTGKFFGLLGSVSIAVYDKDGKVVNLGSVGTGFNDEQREEWKGEFLVGQVIEVEYDEVSARGGLKFPRFTRLRPDKPAKDCAADQLEGL